MNISAKEVLCGLIALWLVVGCVNLVRANMAVMNGNNPYLIARMLLQATTKDQWVVLIVPLKGAPPLQNASNHGSVIVTKVALDVAKVLFKDRKVLVVLSGGVTSSNVSEAQATLTALDISEGLFNSNTLIVTENDSTTTVETWFLLASTFRGIMEVLSYTQLSLVRQAYRSGMPNGHICTA